MANGTGSVTHQQVSPVLSISKITKSNLQNKLGLINS